MNKCIHSTTANSPINGGDNSSTEIINISDDILNDLRDLAYKRNNKPTHVTTCKIATNKSDFDINLEGLKGEYAFSRYYGLPIDNSYYTTSDCGIDFEVNGLTIQCKYTPKPNGDLLVPHWRCVKADVICLTRKVGTNMVEIAGWISTKCFYAIAELKNLKCLTYVLPSDKLAKPQELKVLIAHFLGKGDGI